MTTAAQPTVTVHDPMAGAALAEPFLGAGRYADGSVFVVTERATAGVTLPYAYRSTPTPQGPQWRPVWSLPKALREFFTGQPVGATGKVSNRRVEVLSYVAAVPTGAITLAHGPNVDTWVSW